MVYLRLRTSPLGPDFPRDRFLRTPIRLIRWVMERLDNDEQRQANTASITEARVADLLLKVAHGFSGSRRSPPRTSPKDFLPYPGWQPPSTTSTGPDQPTKFVLGQLVQTSRIPLHVFLGLVTSPESDS